MHQIDNHNQETEAHKTVYPIILRPKDSQFVSRFGEVEIESFCYDIKPNPADLQPPLPAIPKRPSNLSNDDAVEKYRNAWRDRAEAAGWMELLTGTTGVLSKITEIGISGLVAENPSIKKLLANAQADRSLESSEFQELSNHVLEELRGKVEFFLNTAVREFIVNGVYYGNGADPTKQLELAVGYDPEGVFVFWGRDQGTGYNPNNNLLPFADENLGKICGRGVYIILGLLRGEEQVEILYDRTPPVDWPSTLDSNTLGTLRLFDAGRGFEIRSDWKQYTQKIISKFFDQ